MMRFMSDFEKADKIRHMGFTLQAFLSVEILLTSITYYTMDADLKSYVDDFIYMTWLAILSLSMAPMALASALNFARLRATFRVLHMIAIVAVYHFYNAVMMPAVVLVYYSLELGYLLHGIVAQQMEWPGKWMAEMTDKWQESSEDEDLQKGSTSMPFPFTTVAHEVIRKECTIDEEFADDLFEYHTAYEEDLFPQMFQSKTRATFLV